MEWSNVISPATIIALVAAIVGFGGWIFKLGSEARDIASQRSELETLKKECDAFEIAMNAGLAAVKAVHSEFREEVAKTYATKFELAEVERRGNIGMDRIATRLEQISARLETIGDAIIKSLAAH